MAEAFMEQYEKPRRPARVVSRVHHIWGPIGLSLFMDEFENLDYDAGSNL